MSTPNPFRELSVVITASSFVALVQLTGRDELTRTQHWSAAAFAALLPLGVSFFLRPPEIRPTFAAFLRSTDGALFVLCATSFVAALGCLIASLGALESVAYAIVTVFALLRFHR